MRLTHYALCAGIALTLAACQGSFGGTGTPGGITPPVNPQVANMSNPTPTPAPSTSPSIPPGSSVTYAFSQSAKGLQCPQSQGFTCVLKLNVPTPSPSPSAGINASASGSSSPSPSPTPTPTPTPTPSPQPSGAPSPSESPSASPTPSGPQVTLDIEALPKDAPAMVNPDPKAVATTPLVALRMHTNADVTLTGDAIADFTLPKSQIGGRKFAIQLYYESIRKHKRSDAFMGSYAKSTIKGTVLHFEFALPKITVKKNEVWLFVLYGNERPAASSAPAASPSGSPAASASASASPSPASN